MKKNQQSYITKHPYAQKDGLWQPVAIIHTDPNQVLIEFADMLRAVVAPSAIKQRLKRI